MQMFRKQKSEAEKQREKELHQLKWETARELGLDEQLQDPKSMSAREAGRIGGYMSRKLMFNRSATDMADEARNTPS